jgi:adenylate cyclase
MSEPLTVRIFEAQALQFAAEVTGPVQLGRDRGGETPGKMRPIADGTRFVIAAARENSVAREQARVEPIDSSRIRLINISGKVPIGLPAGPLLPPGGACELFLPTVLTLGSKVIRIHPVGVECESDGLASLAARATPPGRPPSGATRFPALTGQHDPRAFLRWLQTVLGVLQSAAGSADFFARAAQAAVEVVGLDAARVLLRDETGHWRPAPEGAPTVEFSRSVLGRVHAERRTFWSSPRAVDHGGSLDTVQAVIAAPILDGRGSVIGALYGERRGELAGARPVTELEALLIELLAGAVAAGLARLEQERQAAAARVRFEQFFTPELARSLSANPGLLAGRDAEVTVLFADVRGYSRVAERLGPAETVQWMREVLGEMSGCVRAEGGVLIDYVGDELMALWGAPAEQPDHAARAARAALAMVRRLPELDKRWRSQVRDPLRVGIGVHSGLAWVGEVGTEHKFKYGPRGHTVNLASRVQGATKYLRVPLLITGAVRAMLDTGFAARRLTTAKVVGIGEHVDLVELAADPPPGWETRRDEYEAALTAFEAGDAGSAAKRLGNVLADYSDDGPALLLLSRAVNALVAAVPYDPVLELAGK